MIGINEAIIGCIKKLLKEQSCEYKNLIQVLEISKSNMDDYVVCKKSIPLKTLTKIAGFFRLSLDEFFIKARISRKKDSDFSAEKILYFKENFLNQFSEDKLIGQFKD